MQYNKKQALETISFIKMHGLGNDFMIIDARTRNIKISGNMVRSLSHRNFGVGFDQLAVLYAPDKSEVIGKLRFWNADGSESPTCGNATRCVASILSQESFNEKISLDTPSGTLICKSLGDGVISVNMGQPKIDWSEIPLSRECDTDHLPLSGDPVATNIGNPHCTFFVRNIANVEMSDYSRYETDKLFPEKTNVQVAEVIGNDMIKVRVWERGVGPTLASGSSACAVAIAAFRRGYTGIRNKIIMEGGDLDISLQEDGVWMTGKTVRVYDGIIPESFFS
ncbi:MAG: diaminopimelate epimerase [Pseudomonadota bacterium]|nr:diaminopimelate epimerase [Pseudomonadota bacterium]